MSELASPTPKPADPEPAQRASTPGAVPDPDAPGAMTAGALGPGAAGPGLSGHAGRDRLVLRSVQRRAGNAAAVALVQRRHAATGRADARRPESAPGATGGPALQRQAPVVQRAGAVIDGTPVTTLADLDRWYMTRIKRLQAQRTDLTSGGVGSPAPIHRAISLGQKEAAACRQDPSAELDGLRAIAAQMWLDKHYRTAHNAAEATRGRAVLARAAKLNASLGKAAGALRSQVLPTLRDAQRTQFMEGNEESLFDLADKIATWWIPAWCSRTGSRRCRRPSGSWSASSTWP